MYMPEGPYQARFEEGLRVYQEAQAPEDYHRALSVFSQLLGARELPDEIRRNSMLLGAKCMNALGRFPDAEPLLRQLLQEIESESEDSRGLGLAASLSLAEALRATGSWRDAIDLFLSTVTHFHESGDWRSEANVHRTIAQLWQEHSQLERAEASLNTAWSILEPYEPTSLHLQVLFSQGHCAHLEGNIESAIDFEERALAVARSIGDNHTESQLVSNLAQLTFSVQDFHRAIHYNAKKLREAGTTGDQEGTARLLFILGACYTETGQSTRAIEMFDEALASFSANHQEQTTEFGLSLLGKAQALLDMKLYDEVEDLLPRARCLLEQRKVGIELLDRIEGRLLRESQAPMVLDCAHRVLQMALSGSSRDTNHRNPQPSIDLTNLQYITTDLTEDDRVRFTNLYKVLSSDLFQMQYSDSDHQDAPGTFTMPLKFEYVDDVEAFEIKWNAYKRELMYDSRCAELQDEWDDIRNQFSFVEGLFRGDKLALIVYVRQLSQIAQLCAEMGNRDLLRMVSLHAADFLEIQTDDPMVAALLWPVRARLIIAAYVLAPSNCHQLLEVELRRSFDQLREVFLRLGRGHRAAALEFIVEPWFSGANKILGHDGYAGLVEIVGDLEDSLDPVDRIRYGIAVGEVYDPAKGVHLVDSLLAKAHSEKPNVRIVLAPEFEIALAVQRFKGLARDGDTCLLQYGPFAPYIHNEVLGWADDVWPASEFEKTAPRSPALAFTDENLVVIDSRLEDIDYVATMVHEMSHRFRRAGQQMRTEDGEWLLVKRDVPIASAVSYLEMLQMEDRGTLGQVAPQIQEMVNLGHSLAEADPERSTLHIKNMLRYFDDLGTHETRASYSCAAILLGMAYGYLLDADAVRSYFQHLKVMDHDEALVYGLKKALLQF